LEVAGAVFVDVEEGTSAAAFGEWFEEFEAEVDDRAGCFAFGSVGVFAAGFGVFDDVVEEDGGGACVADRVGVELPEAFDVGGAVGVEVVHGEDGVERVDDAEADALFCDEVGDGFGVAVVERPVGFVVVEVLGDPVVLDAEEAEAVEEGAGSHGVEVDPGDGQADVEFGFAEDERQPRFHDSVSPERTVRLPG
jgi:hypothetical protein